MLVILNLANKYLFDNCSPSCNVYGLRGISPKSPPLSLSLPTLSAQGYHPVIVPWGIVLNYDILGDQRTKLISDRREDLVIGIGMLYRGLTLSNSVYQIGLNDVGSNICVKSTVISECYGLAVSRWSAEAKCKSKKCMIRYVTNNRRDLDAPYKIRLSRRQH